MDFDLDFVLKKLRLDITEHGMQLKAITKDLANCESLIDLNALNNIGRSKISALRKFIDKFGDIAKEDKNPELLREVVLYREQMASAMTFFKKANLRAILALEKATKTQLFERPEEHKVLRQRLMKDKEGLAKKSSNITDQLLTISRQLAETTEKSFQTLETLGTSSDAVKYTEDELKLTSDNITESGQLLRKYDRREWTDKAIMFFACIFFVICVFYIVQKRLF